MIKTTHFTAHRLRQGLLALAAIVAGYLPAITQAATTYNITTTSMASAVDGECTLVEALASASQNATVNECASTGGPYTINLTPGTYSFMTKTYVDAANFGDTAFSVTLADATVNGNGATLNRGVGADSMRLFYVSGMHSLTLRNVTVSGFNASNTAQPVAQWGGAIAVVQGTLNVEDSTFSDNSCGFGGVCDGAAIMTFSSTVNVQRSAFTGNFSAYGSASHIRINQSSTLNMANTTIDGELLAVAVSFNSVSHIGNATLVGAASIFYYDVATINVQNSLLPSGCLDAGGANTMNASNNAAPVGCNSSSSSFNLGALGNNGGPTQTRSIFVGEFPQDKAPGCTYISSGGNPLFTNGAAIVTDQRGFARDANCDLGAFELFSVSTLTPFAAQVQAPYSATITATGGASPFTFMHSLGTLPPGLSLASDGTLSGTPTTAGNFTFDVTATDSNGFSSTRRYSLFPVSKANQTITFNAQLPANRTFTPSGTFPVNPTASSSSGLAISYASLTTGICTVSGTTVNIVAAGTCTIRASQTGNANFNAATPVTQDVIIDKVNQTLTFNGQAGQTYSPGGTFLVNPVATSTSGLAATYSSQTTGVCTVAGTTVTFVTAGTCTLAANQAGNGNYNAALQVTQSITINPATQTITFGALPDLPLGNVPLTVVPTASSGLAVIITSQTPAVCTATGVNGRTITLLTVGTCTLNTTQTGNGNYLPAAPIARSFSVLLAGGSLSLRSSAPLATYGAAITLTAQIGGFNPGGTVTFSVNADGTGLVVLCQSVPVSGGSASCAASGNLQKKTPVFYLANYSGDASNLAAAATLQQQVNVNAAALSATANPPQPLAGRPVTLRALVMAKSFTSAVTFNENGSALPGCTNVAIAPLPGATDTGVATCTINTIAAGSHNYVVTYPQTPDAYVLNILAQALAVQDYTDMWWAGAAENGWGMSVTQHGSTQFVVLYVYDASGKPVWYVMPGGNWNAGMTTYTGALYLPTSSPFNAYDASRFKANASVGSLAITYTGTGTATLAYTINGVSGTKSVLRQVFGSDDGQPKLQVNDLWWGGSAQDGWGLNIAQQGRVLFPVWYTYDASGKDTWYAVPGGTWNGTTFTGDIYATTSSAWLGANYNPLVFAPVKVGTMTLNFFDQNTAAMTYTVNGVTQTKSIVRQPF